MKLSLTLAVIIISISFKEINSFARVTLYTEREHKGLDYKLPRYWKSQDCLNLPKWLRRNVESVDAAGQCIVICSETNCKGHCVAIFPGNDSQETWFGDLHELKLDNEVQSVKKCF
ncbi:unnamed protein product [Allacma fusca]|uniref:Secreted protein n=1 Tax=Allacma fusca TaxID=39272 RepID=A0A8J2PGD3_9HEXA|nr:unnamed protein product [Allacma fusca]